MEWSRVKSILICVFIIVNVFLLITYIQSFQTGITITEDTLADMTTILNNNQVTIDRDLVPTTIENIRVFDSSNQYASMAEITEKLFGDTAQIELTERSFTCTNLPNQKPISHLTEGAAKKYAKQQLKEMGLFGDMTVSVDAVQTEDGYTVSFVPTFENRNVLDVCLYAKVTEQGITKLFGTNWLLEQMTASAYTTIKSPVDILVQFATTRGQDQTPCTISHLELGYFIGGRNGQSITVTAVPVWEIITEQGSTYYFDAQNGDLLQ